MPAEIKLNLICARDLPIMDVQRKTTDAYCIVKFGRPDKKQQAKTQVENTGNDT